MVGFADTGERDDRDVSLPRPNEPVCKLRLPAADCGIVYRCAEQSVKMRRLALGQAVRCDFFPRALEPESCGGGSTDAQCPECGDECVIRCRVIREIADRVARGIEVRGAEGRRRAGAELARGSQEPGTD